VAKTFGLSAYVVSALIARPEPRVLNLGHSQQLELLVWPDAAHETVVHAADDGERLTAWHMDFMDGDFDYVSVIRGGEFAFVWLEVFAFVQLLGSKSGLGSGGKGR